MGPGGPPRRFLMAEPSGYGVHHILNPWMRWTEAVDVTRAARQWLALATAIEAAGAKVDVMPNRSRSGAMTFTRDTALVTAPGEAIVLRNHGRRGDLEPAHIADWLERHDVVTSELAPDERIDGGNVVPTTDGFVLGIAPGASFDSVRPFATRLRDRTGATVHGVPIRDPKFGHLDTAFSDLAGRGWLVHPGAFVQGELTSDGWTSILRGRPVVEVSDDEASALACNAVVVGDTVIGGLTPRLCRAIEDLDLVAVPVDLDEFRKAGGGAHCLTLELDPVHTDAEPRTTTTTPTTTTPTTTTPAATGTDIDNETDQRTPASSAPVT